MGVISGFVEGIAQDFAIDTAIDKWNEFAEEKVKTKDPYRYETPDGRTKKLKLRDSATKEEQKMWKWVQKRAWVDDKCFMGCYPVDCGIGLGPIVVIFPMIGPILMYLVHAKLVTKATLFYNLDNKTIAKLQANILFDLMLTFPPVVGSLFAWMNGCSTRNAAIIHTEVTKMLIQRERNLNMGSPDHQEEHPLNNIDTQNSSATNPFSNKHQQPAPVKQKPLGYRSNTNTLEQHHLPSVPPRNYGHVDSSHSHISQKFQA